MNVQLSRRQFMKGVGAGAAATTLGALGFGEAESAYAAAILIEGRGRLLGFVGMLQIVVLRVNFMYASA